MHLQQPLTLNLVLQGLRKETELEGLLALAQIAHDGWMPTQHLTGARAMRSWFMENCSRVPPTAFCMAHHLREQLPQLRKPEGMQQLLCLGILDSLS